MKIKVDLKNYSKIPPNAITTPFGALTNGEGVIEDGFENTSIYKRLVNLNILQKVELKTLTKVEDTVSEKEKAAEKRKQAAAKRKEAAAKRREKAEELKLEKGE